MTKNLTDKLEENPTYKKLPEKEQRALKDLVELTGSEPVFVDRPRYEYGFEVSINDNKITYLGLRHMGLKEIPKQINNLQNLKILTLGLNEIKEIGNLNNLINLILLDLSHNKITKIEGLESLENLETLYLQGNQTRNKEKVKRFKALVDMMVI